MKFKDFLIEKAEKHAVLAFGRLQPPTVGHQLLVNKVLEIAKKYKASHHVVLSHTQDKSKNPLTSQQKLKHAKRFFPRTNLSVSTSDDPNFLKQAEKLYKSGVTHLHMIAGSDRISEYDKLLNKYNGTKSDSLFNFKGIQVHSAGERDPDAEGTTGMSASKMRAAAASGNFKKFKEGIPSHVSERHAKELYDDVRAGMKISENIDFEFMLLEGVYDKGIFKAVFLGGGPGSGKDYVLSNTLEGHGLTEINSDKALEYLMDKHGLDKKMPKKEEERRNVVRKRAKNITELRQRLSLEGRNGVIINGTGDDVEKILKIKDLLEKLGYESKMIMVNTADEVSKQRNIERGQRGGRTVPEEIRKEKWDSVQAARPEFAKAFGSDYHEFDNSEDLRTAPEEVKKQKQDEMMGLFKNVQEFVARPPQSEQAQQWVAQEMQKKDTAPIPKENDKKMPHEGSAASEEAAKLGLDYYGFGRYGNQGKVTHRVVNDKLVDVTKMTKNNNQKKSVNEEFENFLSEAVSFTVTADTPEEATKFLKMLKDGEPEEVEEVEENNNYELSSSAARNVLLLGTQIAEGTQLFESDNNEQYFTDKNGKVKRFYLRHSAAKEAHTKNGEIEKRNNYYVIKLRRKTNEEVNVFYKEHILTESSSSTNSTGSSRSGGPRERSNQTTESKEQTPSKKITIQEIRAKQKTNEEKTNKKMKNDPCWDGYEMVGMKDKNGKKVPNCVPVKEDWQKVNKADKTDGLSQKAVDAYRRENPGSKLQTAVTEKNPKGKRASRRKSFCSRMSGMKKRLTKSENARDPDSPINKALRRWRC